MYHFYLIASQLFYVLTLHVSSIYIHVPLLPHCLTIILCSNITCIKYIYIHVPLLSHCLTIILCSNITCIKYIYTCTTSISLPHNYFMF